MEGVLAVLVDVEELLAAVKIGYFRFESRKLESGSAVVLSMATAEKFRKPVECVLSSNVHFSHQSFTCDSDVS